MSDFIENLRYFCTEDVMPPVSKAYEKKFIRQNEMDDQIIEAFGKEFYDEYYQLGCDLHDWETAAHFQEGLRFGLKLAIEVLTE